MVVVAVGGGAVVTVAAGWVYHPHICIAKYALCVLVKMCTLIKCDRSVASHCGN